MEKTGEPIAEAVEVAVQVYRLWNHNHEVVGFQVGIFGPARTPRSRTWLLYAFHADNLHVGKEHIYATAEEAERAWQVAPVRLLDEMTAARLHIGQAVRQAINAQSLYKERDP